MELIEWQPAYAQKGAAGGTQADGGCVFPVAAECLLLGLDSGLLRRTEQSSKAVAV